MSEFDAKKYRDEYRRERIKVGLCTRCGKPATGGLKDCQECIDETRDRVQQRRDDCRRLGICIQCGKPSRANTLRCVECTTRMNKSGILRHKKSKAAVLSYYGKEGKAQCCWNKCKVDDVDMLTLDHVDDNGAKHRREYTKSGRGGGSVLYDLLIRQGFPEGFQTLCANHNLKKHITGFCDYEGI